MSLIRWLHGSSLSELMRIIRYHHYDDETRVKIAKYLCECGNKAAADKFTKELGFLVTEKDPERICSLPHGSRGRPLMLGQNHSFVEMGM